MAAASFWSNEATRVLLAAMAGKDMRVRAVMNGTTCDTENDGIVNLADFTTIDVCDDTAYADKALAAEAVAKDDANDRSEFDATDLTGGSAWTLNGDSTDDIVGLVLYEFVTTDADHIFWMWIKFPSVLSKTTIEIAVTWNAEGIGQLLNA